MLSLIYATSFPRTYVFPSPQLLATRMRQVSSEPSILQYLRKEKVGLGKVIQRNQCLMLT